MEQEAKAKESVMSQEIQYAVFDAMKISDEDWKLIDAIFERAEPLCRVAPRKRTLPWSNSRPSSNERMA